MSNYLIFRKPTSNIQRAFGLFAQLEKLGYSRGPLNPTESFIVISKRQKTFYSSHQETQCTSATDIPANYNDTLTKFIKA